VPSLPPHPPAAPGFAAQPQAPPPGSYRTPSQQDPRIPDPTLDSDPFPAGSLAAAAVPRG